MKFWGEFGVLCVLVLTTVAKEGTCEMRREPPINKRNLSIFFRLQAMHIKIRLSYIKRETVKDKNKHEEIRVAPSVKSWLS